MALTHRKSHWVRQTKQSSNQMPSRCLNVRTNANFRDSKNPLRVKWDWEDANSAIIKSKRFHSTHILSRASTQNVCISDAILFLFRLYFDSSRLDFPSFTLLCRTRTHSLAISCTTHRHIRNFIASPIQSHTPLTLTHTFESCVAVGSAVAFVVPWKHTLLGIYRTHTFLFSLVQNRNKVLK